MKAGWRVAEEAGFRATREAMEEHAMANRENTGDKKRLIRVMDRNGTEFVCPANALKNPDELTEEEKARCVDALSDEPNRHAWT